MFQHHHDTILKAKWKIMWRFGLYSLYKLAFEIFSEFHQKNINFNNYISSFS